MMAVGDGAIGRQGDRRLCADTPAGHTRQLRRASWPEMRRALVLQRAPDSVTGPLRFMGSRG